MHGLPSITLAGIPGFGLATIATISGERSGYGGSFFSLEHGPRLHELLHQDVTYSGYLAEHHEDTMDLVDAMVRIDSVKDMDGEVHVGFTLHLGPRLVR